MNRRQFLKRAFGSALGIGVFTSLYTWQVEPFWLEFTHRKMTFDALPVFWKGKTLMQISDIHVGKLVDDTYLKESFLKASTHNPDIVVYTGDFVSYVNAEQFDQLEQLMENAVLGKYGTYAVLGNHDYGHKWSEPKVADRIVRILEKHGVKVLRNQKVINQGVTILGVDDFWGTNFHPSSVLKTVQKKDVTLALCHNPDVCDMNVWHDFSGWIVSGHTHGGQCKPPFLPPPVLPVTNTDYTSGEFHLDKNRKLYINRGLGYVLQARFNVRPEITLFELA